MKPVTLLILCILILGSCKNDKETSKPEAISEQEISYASFGKSIIAKDAIALSAMMQHYQGMAKGDSINSKLKAKVTDVCQAKGCWMTLTVDDGKEVMVKFKDYGFFVPKDIKGKEVIVNGLAYVDEISIEEQKHYAEDAGKSEADIAQIISPKRSYSFEADGVLIPQ